MPSPNELLSSLEIPPPPSPAEYRQRADQFFERRQYGNFARITMDRWRLIMSEVSSDASCLIAKTKEDSTRLQIIPLLVTTQLLPLEPTSGHVSTLCLGTLKSGIVVYGYGWIDGHILWAPTQHHLLLRQYFETGDEQYRIDIHAVFKKNSPYCRSAVISCTLVGYDITYVYSFSLNQTKDCWVMIYEDSWYCLPSPEARPAALRINRTQLLNTVARLRQHCQAISFNQKEWRTLSARAQPLSTPMILQ